MALADYYLCDICEEKTFYDANLHYEDDGVHGQNFNPLTYHPWPTGRVGLMVVLCRDCAAKHSGAVENILQQLKECQPQSGPASV